MVVLVGLGREDEDNIGKTGWKGMKTSEASSELLENDGRDELFLMERKW